MAAAEDLQALRAELDTLDHDLLALAARRAGIVRRIGAAKASSPTTKPLFDRDRERAVYDRAERIAADVDLPTAVARRLLAVLVEHSHETQEHAALEGARAGVARRILIVGGGGRMGRRLGGALTARGHAVDVLEADDGRDRPAAIGAADVVMVAVPMAIAEVVVEEVAPHVRADALLCDINSLKTGVCARMAATERGEAIGLHPMFGPTVHTLRRQKVVVCPVRDGALGAWLRTEFEQMGMEVIESDPETHDRMMSIVQVLTHFSTIVMGEALRSTGVALKDSLRFTSPIYRLELAFVGRLFAQSARLYGEIEMTNPHAAEVRRSFLDAATRLDQVIGRGDRETFEALFDGVSRYFQSFAEEAMGVSDHIIDTLVAERP